MTNASFTGSATCGEMLIVLAETIGELVNVQLPEIFGVGRKVAGTVEPCTSMAPAILIVISIATPVPVNPRNICGAIETVVAVVVAVSTPRCKVLVGVASALFWFATKVVASFSFHATVSALTLVSEPALSAYQNTSV